MDLTRPRRTNGLNPPYTPAQVATWVFLPLLCLEFLFFVTPLLPLAASIPCTIFFMASAFASVFYAYTAMKIDPADPRLCTSVTTRNNNSEATKQCWICDIQVGEKSMHCKFCNKCVDHFDHHCMCKLLVLGVDHEIEFVNNSPCCRNRAEYLCWKSELPIFLSDDGVDCDNVVCSRINPAISGR